MADGGADLRTRTKHGKRSDYIRYNNAGRLRRLRGRRPIREVGAEFQAVRSTENSDVAKALTSRTYLTAVTFVLKANGTSEGGVFEV